jgi:uncharacterized protein
MTMPEIPQIVPSPRCLACDVCCRFPEAESPLRPYFTEAEIRTAIASGLPEAVFPEKEGGKIRLIPNPAGEGYLCPAFDPGTNHCTIYAARPLDCRLYPFAVMRDPQGTEAVLGWDRKCPYLMNEADHRLPLSASGTVGDILQREGPQAVLNRNPGLIGEFQQDVWVTEPLPAIRPRIVPRNSPAPGLKEIGREDFRLLQTLMEAGERHDLSHAHLSTILMWKPLMRLFRAETKEGPVIVAEQGGAFFLPVPPFTKDIRSASCRALDLLDSLNKNPGPSRIERISTAQKDLLADSGLLLRHAGDEYLYERSTLVGLTGRRYKSHRWNVNQAGRRLHPEIRPFAEEDLGACMNLYARWRCHKEKVSRDPYALALSEDGFYGHHTVLTNRSEWDVVCRVACVKDRVRAYTAGISLGPETFLILLEIADPDIPGLGPYLFREFCREMKDYRWINAMDDSGVEAIRKTKEAYGPDRLIPFYTATRKNT